MRTKLVIAAVATAAAVSAVGASAYTASITNPDPGRVVGYAATPISGADFASYPVLTYSTGLDEVTQIDVVLTGDTHTSALSVNRNAGAAVACGAGVYATNTTYHCTGLTFAVAGMTSIGYALQ